MWKNSEDAQNAYYLLSMQMKYLNMLMNKAIAGNLLPFYVFNDAL